MKAYLRVLVLAFTFVFVLSSCGSMEKNAREKLEEGDFDGSVQLFEKVVANDPSNAEAVADLKRARQGVIGNKLIQVRTLRAGGNAQGALDRLLEVVNLEKQWSTSPHSNAQFSQDEETGFALKYFFDRQNLLVKEGKTLLADSDLARYSPIFTNKKGAEVLSRIRSHIKQSGKSKCANAQNDLSAQTPYTNAFMRDYCAYWGSPLRKLPASDSARLAPLFSGIKYSGELRNLSPELLTLIKGRLNDALAGSAWFDSKSPSKLELNLNGEAKFAHASNMVSLIHEYTKSEPYSTTEKVAKTRQVPHTTTKLETDPVTHVTKAVPTTVYETENYTEEQPVIRYQDVKKQYPYSAMRHNQVFDFNFAASGEIHDQTLSLELSDHKENQSDDQQLAVSDVGLVPHKAVLLNPAEWLQDGSNRIRSDFSQKLSALWIGQHCGSLSAKTSLEQDERILRCARDPAGAKLPVVQEWYRNRFGLEAPTVLSMISSQSK